MAFKGEAPWVSKVVSKPAHCYSAGQGVGTSLEPQFLHGCKGLSLSLTGLYLSVEFLLNPTLYLETVVISFIPICQCGVLVMRSLILDRDIYYYRSYYPHCHLYDPLCWPIARSLLQGFFAHLEFLGHCLPQGASCM